MAYKLEQPYTDIERADFIVKYNHQQNLEIVETEEYLYALEPNEYYEDGEIKINENYEAEQLQVAKDAKYNEIYQGAKSYLESGNATFALSDTQHIEATDGNIGKLSAYALAFITGTFSSTDTVEWTTKEDEVISLTQETLTQVMLGLGAVQAEIWNVRFTAYITQLNACTTIEEVEAIVVNYAS